MQLNFFSIAHLIFDIRNHEIIRFRYKKSKNKISLNSAILIINCLIKAILISKSLLLIQLMMKFAFFIFIHEIN